MENQEFQTFDVWLAMVRRIPDSIEIMAQFAMPFHESMWYVAQFLAGVIGFIALMTMGVKALADPRSGVYSWVWQVALVAICLMPVKTGKMFGAMADAEANQYRVAFVVRATHQLTTIAARAVFSGIDRASQTVKGIDGAPVSTSALSVFNTAINTATGEPDLINLLADYNAWCGGAVSQNPPEGIAPIPGLTWKMMGLNGGQGLGVQCDDNGQNCNPDVLLSSSRRNGWTLWSSFFGKSESVTGANNAVNASGRIGDAKTVLQSISLSGDGKTGPRYQGYRVLSKGRWIKNFTEGRPGTDHPVEDYIQNTARGNQRWADPWIAANIDAADLAPEYVRQRQLSFFPKNCLEMYELGSLSKAQYLNALRGVHKTTLTGAGSAGYFAGSGSALDEAVTKNSVLAAAAAIESANYAVKNGTPYAAGMPQQGLDFGDLSTYTWNNAKYTMTGHDVKAHTMSGLVEIGNWVEKWLVEFGLYGFVGVIAFAYAMVFVLAPLAIVSALLPGRAKAILLVVESMVFLQVCMVITYAVIKLGALAMYGLYQAAADANVYNMTFTPIAHLVITIKAVTLVAVLGLPIPVGMMLVFAEGRMLAKLKSNQFSGALAQGASTTAAAAGLTMKGAGLAAKGAQATERAREKVMRANDRADGMARQQRQDSERAADRAQQAPLKAAQASGYKLGEAMKLAKSASAANGHQGASVAQQVSRLEQEHIRNLEALMPASEPPPPPPPASGGGSRST